MADIDEHAAVELKLFIDNDGDLYRRQTTSILKNLATKKVRSQYKHDLAVKAFGYLVESGAKKYATEFDDPKRWHKLFDVPTRKAVAEELTRDFETEFELGNYDHLLPKKYQKEMLQTKHLVPPHPHHARKKLDEHIGLHKPSALRSATDRQVRSFYTEEKRDAARALAEANRRGLALNGKRKSASQLDREIANMVPSWRKGR